MQTAQVLCTVVQLCLMVCRADSTCHAAAVYVVRVSVAAGKAGLVKTMVATMTQECGAVAVCLYPSLTELVFAPEERGEYRAR